jgi:hypothetical protein
MSARLLETQRTQAHIRCRALNLMTHLRLRCYPCPGVWVWGKGELNSYFFVSTQ